MAQDPEILVQVHQSWGQAFIEDMAYWTLTGTLVLLFITAIPLYLEGPDKVQWRRFLVKCAVVFAFILAVLAWYGFDPHLAAQSIGWFCREHYFIVSGLFALGIGFQYTLYYVLIPRMVGVAPFNAEAWIKGDRLARSRMVNGLIRDHNMTSLNRKEVHAMLGDPDYTRETDNALVYDLDCERRLAVIFPTAIKDLKVKMFME